MDRRESRALIERLNRDAERIARRFELRYSAIEAERPHLKQHYGICYSDGVIKIRLRHAATGRPLKYSSLVNTLCHELAHLRHFDHGPRFKAFYFRLLDFARAEGIYRPGPEPARSAPLRVAGPVQLDLF
jgi:predicted metal-dependent hydrolase